MRCISWLANPAGNFGQIVNALNYQIREQYNTSSGADASKIHILKLQMIHPRGLTVGGWSQGEDKSVVNKRIWVTLDLYVDCLKA